VWMVDLTYYDTWYRQAPEIHKSIGILLSITLLLRLIWRWANARPRPEPGLTPFERRASSATHVALYVLLFAVMASGYLISTADGRSIGVFGWFGVPALISRLPNQADLAGDIHLALAISLIALAGIHAAGALKHHFLDRNRTLVRMLGVRRS
jgi:cytochrome b561